MFKTLLSSIGKNSIIKLFSILALVVTIISGIFYFNSLGNKNIVVNAAPVCPANFSWNTSLNTCRSDSPTDYTCSSGFRSGTNCFSYSCPQGGEISGGSCVASDAAPIPVTQATGCPANPGFFFLTVFDPSTSRYVCESTSVPSSDFVLTSTQCLAITGIGGGNATLDVYIGAGTRVCGYFGFGVDLGAPTDIASYWNLLSNYSYTATT